MIKYDSKNDSDEKCKIYTAFYLEKNMAVNLYSFIAGLCLSSMAVGRLITATGRSSQCSVYGYMFMVLQPTEEGVINQAG